MEMPRFSVFEADLYGARIVLDNIRLFVLTALAKIATFVAYFLITGLISLLFIKPQSFGFFVRPFLFCRTREEFLDILGYQTRVLPTIYQISSAHWIALLTFSFIFLFLGFGIYLGFIRIVLTLHDTGKSRVRLLFSCFGLVPKSILAGFLFGVMVSIGLLLLVIPGIYLSLRFCFFPYFIVDKNAGIIDSLRRSFKVTEGQIWQLFGVFILPPAIISMPGGIFFITPFITAVLTYIYRKLTG